MNNDIELLEKKIKKLKILRLIFILGGILFIVGGAFLSIYGIAYIFGGVFAVIISAGNADVSDLAGAGYIMFIAGIVVMILGLGSIIAGSIVTSVKIKNRNAQLMDLYEH